MPIWRLRKSSFARSVAAYRSQWKRSLARMFIPGYGKRGRGIWRDPKRARYNFEYHRRTVGMKQFGRSSHTTRLLATFVIGVGTLLNIITLPVDVAKTAIVAGKVAKTRKARAERSYTNTNSRTRTTAARQTRSRSQATHKASSQSNSNHSTASRSTSSYSSTLRTPREPSYSERETDMKPAVPRAEQPASRPAVKSKPSEVRVVRPVAVSPKKEEPRPSVPTITTEAAAATFEPLVKPVVARKEDDPKSIPKHEKDQYIRKRMMISNTTPKVESLCVGDYLDIVSSPTTEDKGAIALRASSGLVGYLSRADRAPYAACLKLSRLVYAVVSDISSGEEGKKYEIETWYGTKE